MIRGRTFEGFEASGDTKANGGIKTGTAGHQ